MSWFPNKDKPRAHPDERPGARFGCFKVVRMAAKNRAGKKRIIVVCVYCKTISNRDLSSVRCASVKRCIQCRTKKTGHRVTVVGVDDAADNAWVAP